MTTAPLLIGKKRFTKLLNRRVALTIAFLTLLVVFVIRWNGFTLITWASENLSGTVVRHSGGRQRLVALTFDDGPSAKYTLRMLSILDRYHAHATFFEVGKNMRRYPEITRQVLLSGNEIGNHTETHPYIERLNSTRVALEIDDCARDILDVAHVSTSLFRPPRGAWNPIIFREATKRKLKIVLWSTALEHEATPNPGAMAKAALDSIQPGGILLMHDGAYPSRESTVIALPSVIETLQKRGYRLVTVSELLDAHD